MNVRSRRLAPALLMTAALLAASGVALAQDSTVVRSGTIPMSEEPDVAYKGKHFFPLWQDKLTTEQMRRLPPAYGIMAITNWLQSDWEFKSAAISLGGSNPISLDAAEDATMQLEITTTGLKADVWVLPFLDVMGTYGDVEVAAELGLRDIPLDFDAGSGYTYGDAIIPMEFDGTFYGIGIVPAYGYRHFYFAADMSWVKTKLSGSADLDASGFVTFTAAPKAGYNAGMSQLYVGARYVSKNERYTGTVDLPSGNPLGFDVEITTASWAPNVGMRTIIQNHWEIIMEMAGGPREQMTFGVGYRW
jgi:hypothetical protein